MISEQRMVDRTRLLKRVRNSVSRIVALIAPAGFGKTCTAREIVATIGGPSVEWDAALAAPSELVNELRTAWMNAPPDATLLLDSLELASVDPAFQAVLAEIIRNRGERTIIIAARPPFPLLNTRILPPGGYVRFGPDDLRFTIEEVRAALGVAFDDEQIERVVSATGGWPFGVFAVGERAAGGDLDAVLDALREGKLTDVSDYVCNEIIAGLPNDLRRLLVAVAAVGMCGSAALGHSLAHPDLSNALALLSATLPITRDDEGGDPPPPARRGRRRASFCRRDRRAAPRFSRACAEGGASDAALGGDASRRATLTAGAPALSGPLAADDRAAGADAPAEQNLRRGQTDSRVDPARRRYHSLTRSRRVLGVPRRPRR